MATIITREVGATAKGSPLTNAEVDNNFINLRDKINFNAELSKDLIGFVDRTSSSLTFDAGTRTLTLTPTGTVTVYKYGEPYQISSPLTLQITNTTGGRYIAYNTTTLQLAEVGEYPDFRSQIVVSYIYWDATNQKAIIAGDERHSVQRDTQWHYSQHRDVGAIWRSGGAITYTLDSATVYRFGLASPINIADEDIEISITHSATPVAPYQQILETVTNAPVVYLGASGYVQADPVTSQWLVGASTAYYNPVVGSTGSIVQADSNKYLTYWVIATNDMYYPVKLIMGQQQHNSVGDAEAEEFADYGLPVPELVPMYRIVIQTSSSYTNKVIIRSVKILEGRQVSTTNAFNIGSGTSHDVLSGRSLADQHPIGAITGLQTALDGKENVGTAVALAIALG